MGYPGVMSVHHGGGVEAPANLEFRENGEFYEVFLTGSGPDYLIATVRKDMMLKYRQHAGVFGKLMQDVATEIIKDRHGVTPFWNHIWS